MEKHKKSPKKSKINEAKKNKDQDPEQIPAGAMLRIPPKSEYGINYKDPESVRKAKLAAHRVLKDL